MYQSTKINKIVYSHDTFIGDYRIIDTYMATYDGVMTVFFGPKQTGFSLSDGWFYSNLNYFFGVNHLNEK